MSATRSPRWAKATARFVAVSVFPVPPFGPRMQTSRELIRSSGRLGSLLPCEELVDLEAHLVPGGREHDDVVGSRLERAPQEPVRRPVPEHDDRELGVVP